MMKKIKIKRKLRLMITILLFFIISVLVVSLSWLYTRPLEAAKETNVFSYKQKAYVDYEVNYRANEFIPRIPQTSQKAYIKDLTDYISTVFHYSFSGQRQISAEGEYGVQAVITAYTGVDRDVVWQKDYVLIKPTFFTVNDKDLAIQERVRIPFSEYVNFANRAAEEISYSPDDLELSVKYYVSVKAETDSGTILEEAAPMMVIPMRGRVYSVGGDLAVEKADGIKSTQMVPVPFIRERRMGCSIAAGFSAVLLLSFLLFTVPKEKELSPMEKTVRHILKKHRDRIVICESYTRAIVPGKTIQVNTFDDLVKVSDELGKPILYKSLQNDSRQDFVVFADDTYICSVMPYSFKEKAQIPRPSLHHSWRKPEFGVRKSGRQKNTQPEQGPVGSPTIE